MTLSRDELALLRCLAGMMIPASAEFSMPGADDDTIFADITATMGRDADDIRTALNLLPADLPTRPAAERDALVATWRSTGSTALATLGRVILQCYYRDSRVMTALGREARPPFPRGHVLEQGDWSLLEPVRGRAAFWRRT